MNKKLKAISIVQGATRGSVQFADVDKDGKQVPKTDMIVIQFDNPKDAAKFEHGKEYTISITTTK